MSSKARNRVSLFLACLVAYVFVELIPIIFQASFRPPNSESLWGVPALISHILDMLGLHQDSQSNSSSSPSIQHLSFSLGMIASAALAWLFSKRLLGMPIEMGDIRYSLLLWLLGAIILGTFGPAIIDFGADLAFGTLPEGGVEMPQFALPHSDITQVQDLLLRAISSLVVAPFCEEIVYRGYLSNYLLRFLGVPIAGIIASMAFAFAHVFSVVSFGHGAVLFCAGMLLFYARLRFSGIGAPILLHFGTNFTIFFFVL